MKITEVMKKLLAIALSLCMLFQYVPVTAFAAAENGLCEHHSVHTDECGYAEGVSDCTYHCDACHTHDEPKTEETVAVPIESESIVVTATAAPEVDLPENDELFAMYAEQKLYGSQWSILGTAARENLNGVEQAIYDALKTKIETVAASGGSAHFELSNVSGLKTRWTSEELGVDSIEDTAMIGDLFDAQFSIDNIIGALLSDCPFDLYWYDKTEGTGMSYGIGRSGQNIDGTTYWTEANINDLAFTFEVASDYQGGDNTTVTSGVAKVGAAKTKAQSIVSTYAAKRDYEKLVAYKDEICNLVSYNDEAAANDYTGGYGDPWQLIYVFDGDPATEVVCEGYSKAFQYLCDLSGLDCISVSGYLADDTSDGRHMWNIVTLGGANYLADVTNCDEGTVGAPDALFLVGDPNYSLEMGCSFTIGSQNIYYFYDEDTISTWTESQLMLAAEDYTVPDPAVCTHSWENGTCTLCGEVCSHTGGSASCTAQAVCTVCGSSYGEIRAHSFDSNNICSSCNYGENPNISISDGNITLSGSRDVTYYQVGSKQGVYTGAITITGSSTSNTVSVISGTHAVELNTVTIDVSSRENTAAFKVSTYTGSTNPTVVNLMLGGENTLKSGSSCAGLQVSTGASLNINGLNNGSLDAFGGAGAAGIGGQYCYSGGTITIRSGTVNATGGENGAGIGGGESGNGGTITINGGTVTATGGVNGAGIGSGHRTGFGSNITIRGGTVTATGGENGAGIGGGKNSPCGTVIIYGGEITANGGKFAPGIGDQGNTSKDSTITIGGGHVTAKGGDGKENVGAGGAGIGHRGCIVTISGGTVNATGGYYRGAGIADSILISGGTVTATGGYYGEGIKIYYDHRVSTVFPTISGGTVIATGGWHAAGIGGSNLVIAGGNVLAIGDAANGAEDIDGGTYNGFTGDYAPVSLVPINVAYASDGTPVISAEGIGDYGLKDVVTIGDMLYFYLPASDVPTSVNGKGLVKQPDGSYTTDCKHTSTEIIPAQAPTCSAPGLTEGTKCAVCGKILVEQQVDNSKGDHSFVNGFCVYCDGYQPCEGAGTEASPYLIANAGNLYWFAAQVNGGKDSLCAKLTADIVVNENVLNADGTLNGTPARIWTIIARPNSGGPELYNGIFDGNGHTISGLYFNDFGDNDDIQFVGLFGAVETGSVVKDLGIIDSYFRANTYVGAVVGNSYGTITNCYNKATVSGVDYIGGLTGRNDGVITDCYNAGVIIGEYDAGGIAGCNYDAEITDCYNAGVIISEYYAGGVAGMSDGEITDCYNTGVIMGERYSGGLTGRNDGVITVCYNTGSVTCTDDRFDTASGGVVGVNREGATVKNCHNTGTVTGKQYVGGVIGELEFGTTVANCYYLSDSETDSISGTTAKNAEQFASGEVAWMLNSKSDSKVWGQTIGTDAYPGFTGGTVYRNQIAECNGIAAYAYSNTQADPVTGHVPGAAATCTTPQTCTVCGTELAETLGHAFVDGTCTACGEVCSHTGGTASCTEKAKCETCGMEYGELPGHSFTDGFCTVCGVGIACNAATGAAYGTLTEALAAAEAGQTVVMQSDSTENRILILPGVTLDLNGHTLTADYVVGFNTSKICDSSNCADNGYVAEGLLKVQPDNIVLYEGNGAVPVYNPEKEGFIFVDFLFNSKTAEKDDGTYLNMLVTSRTMEVIDLLKDGAADNDIQVMVRLTWDNETGTAYQDFVFNESTVQNVMSSNNGTFNGFGSMFFVKITGLEALENVTATVMIVSGSNAVDQGKTLNAN